MLFNSLQFAVFFPVVYAVYLLLPHRWQNRFLLLASYVFYGSWDWRFLFLILLSTLVDYVCGLKMHEAVGAARRRTLLLISLTTNLGLLGVFKYFDFFASSLLGLLSFFGLRADSVTLNLVLPVGISFYTFQTLSYTIDVYRGRLEPERDLADFALFVAFFPQLVAGPIERATRLLPQIKHPRRIDREMLASGAWMVLWGYFLKIFMADNLAPLVDSVFAGDVALRSVSGWLAVYAFAFQILGDFAGYSFIAMGVSKLLGIELSINFRFPYFVTNPSDFWKHWHISLSSWLRDYLYIPLGGNRASRTRVAANLMLTMLLGGLWHGAAWTFVIWGAYQGLLLAAQRVVEGVWSSRRWPAVAIPSNIALGFRIVMMFHLTCIGWLVFRAASVGQIGDFLAVMLSDVALPTQGESLMFLQLAFYSGVVLVIQWLQRRSGIVESIAGIPVSMRLPLSVLMFYALLVWGNYGGGEFIYFQF